MKGRTSRALAVIGGTGALGVAVALALNVSSGAAAAAARKGTTAAARPSWCGSKKISFALSDGFGNNNWREITVEEARLEAAQCPSVTKFVYTNGEGNTQQSISQITGLVSQGINAIVDFPDAGPAMLPVLTKAYHAGTVVVPWRVSPGGKAGVNYNYFISTNFAQAGVLWAKFLLKALPHGGNIVNLGGPPNNSQSLDEYQGMVSVLKAHPDFKFIGQKPYNVTNWDPATTEKVITALLAKYPKIDAITTDFGAALADSFGAFSQAGRKVPIVATEDANLLSCDRQSMLKTDPGFKLFTVDSQNWMVRIAVDFAVAKATGGKLPSSEVAPQAAFENSLTGAPKSPTCDKALPGTALMSSIDTTVNPAWRLTPAQEKKALGVH